MGSTFIRDMGYVSQGIDDYNTRKIKQAQDQATLEQQNQANQRGSMGLAEMTRVSKEQEAQRTATMGAQPNAHDIAVAKADQALKSGNHDEFNKYAQEAYAITNQANIQMLNDAARGVPPDQIESSIKRLVGNGVMDEGSLKYAKSQDGPTKGHIIVSYTKNGVPQQKDATQMMAAQEPPVKLGEGEQLVNPRSGVVTAANKKVRPLEKFQSKDENGVETQQGYDLETGKWIAPPAAKGSAQSPAFGRHDLPITNEIAKSVYSIPGMGEKDMVTGTFNPTPEGSKRATVANQIYIGSNKKIDPQLAAEIAIKGQPMFDSSSGKRWIEYGGKQYPWTLPGQDVAQQAAPQPQPAPVVPSSTPAAQQPAPVQQPPRDIKVVQAEINALMKQPAYLGMDLKTRDAKLAALKDEATRAMRTQPSKYARGGKISAHGMC